MNGAGRNLADWVNRFKTELRQDKKKTTVLLVLLVTAGIVGGRFVVTHSPPSGAEAAVEPAATGDQNTPADLIGQNDESGRKARWAEIASLDRNITRDLFTPNTEHFPLAEGAASQSRCTSGRKSGPFQQARKWFEAKQSDQRERLEYINSVRAEAKGLSLKSIMLGRAPTALINGQVLRTGQMINGFRLKTIASDCCIVSKDGIEVELRMGE